MVIFFIVSVLFLFSKKNILQYYDLNYKYGKRNCNIVITYTM